MVAPAADVPASTHVSLGDPMRWVGRQLSDLLGYFGGMVLLAGSSLRSIVRPEGEPPPLVPAVLAHLDNFLLIGVPLCGLVHVGMGSFLAMQAFFGATFVLATGPVVGVGLFRNVAPLLTGFTLAGILASKLVLELRGHSRVGLDGEPTALTDRDVLRGKTPDRAQAPEPGRLTAARVLAAMVACPILAIWSGFVGTTMGCLVASEMLEVPRTDFLGSLWPMIWGRDVLGILVKGLAFGGVAALAACHEGLRGPINAKAVPAATFRAVFVSAGAILMMNSTWFVVAYRLYPVFGPTVMTPPGQ